MASAPYRTCRLEIEMDILGVCLDDIALSGLEGIWFTHALEFYLF